MNKFENYLEVRKDIYLLLSYWFYMEVDNKYLNDVKDKLPIFLSIAESAKNEQMINSCSILKNFFDKTVIDENIIEEFACEFAKLFLITSKDAGIKSITAQESVYLSESKMMMQDERDEVLRVYVEESVALVDDVFKEPEDHISAELYFISKMSDDCINASKDENVNEIKRNLKVQYDFINQHTIKWINELSSDIISATQYDFFKAMAALTATFIQLDFIELKELLSEINDIV